MNSIEELRNELANVFKGLLDGSIEAGEAKEINNSAGKIIGTLKVELEYADLRNERPHIKFIDPNAGPQTYNDKNKRP